MLKGALKRESVRMALGAVLLLGGVFVCVAAAVVQREAAVSELQALPPGCNSAGKAGTVASCRQGTGWNTDRGKDDAEGSSE